MKEIEIDHCSQHLIGKTRNEAYNFEFPYGDIKIEGNIKIINHCYFCKECCKKHENGKNIILYFTLSN